MNKKVLLFGGIGLVLILIILILVFAFTGSDGRDATLDPEGTVFYKTLDSDWIETKDSVALFDGYSVKTENSAAKISFSSGCYSLLGKNTEVVIDSTEGNKISLLQKEGKLWNRIFKVSGVGEYDVEMPNTIASVRGTGFATYIFKDREQVGVIDGRVEVKPKADKGYGVEKEKQIINYFNKVELGDLKRDDFIKKGLEEDEKYIKAKIESLKQKYKWKLKLIQAKGVDDKTINHYLRIYIVKGKQAMVDIIQKEHGMDVSDYID
jgi:hypothetical protein